MKKKSNFLLKAICILSVLASILVFVFLVFNLEETKVRLMSSKKVDIKSEAQEVVRSVPREPIVVPMVDENGEEIEETEEDLGETEVTEEFEEDIKEFENVEETEIYIETELNNENCNYEIDEKTNTIKINGYFAPGDCVIIPDEIDGVKVESINTEDFSNSTSLEKIKVAKEIANLIGDIPNFEVNESLEEENYIVYTTTREYCEAYKAYLNLTEEEKSNTNFIPPKYEIPLELEKDDEEIVLKDTIESAYDLRDDIPIKVESQNPYGICYGYAALSSAETFWRLNYGESVDFSDAHLAVRTTGNGGNYDGTNSYFASKYGPIYEEEIPINDIKHGIFPNASTFSSALKSSSPSSYSAVQTVAKSKTPVKYVTDTRTFSSITIDYKKDSAYDDIVQENRNNIKEHIKKYGGVATVTNSGAIKEYN